MTIEYEIVVRASVAAIPGRNCIRSQEIVRGTMIGHLIMEGKVVVGSELCQWASDG